MVRLVFIHFCGVVLVNRRCFLVMGLGVGASTLMSLGCRGHQYGQVLSDHQADAVGSHAAGAETFNPLIDEAVTKLLARQEPVFRQASTGELPPPVTSKSICFAGVENKSAEELGDFKDQIYEQIDAQILASQMF